jgi:hypothetical protein
MTGLRLSDSNWHRLNRSGREKLEGWRIMTRCRARIGGICRMEGKEAIKPRAQAEPGAGFRRAELRVLRWQGTGPIFTGPGQSTHTQSQNGFLEPNCVWVDAPASSGSIQFLDETKAIRPAPFPIPLPAAATTFLTGGLAA